MVVLKENNLKRAELIKMWFNKYMRQRSKDLRTCAANGIRSFKIWLEYLGHQQSFDPLFEKEKLEKYSSHILEIQNFHMICAK